MRFREPLYHGIRIDRRSGRTLHDQLVDELRRLVRCGALTPGSRVPSTRTLATTLRISRSVAQSAFLSLHAEGLLVSRRGSGSYVRGGPAVEPAAAEPGVGGSGGGGSGGGGSGGGWPDSGAGEPPAGSPGSAVLPGRVDLTPEQPNLEVFPQVAWRSAWRRACHQVPAARQDPLGEPALRAAIAEHLRITRGIVCQARQVLVCAGRRGVLDAVANLLARDGGAVAVDDPGSPAVRRALRSRGAAVLAAPVDGDGVRPDALDPVAARGARARHLLTCPGHQFPLGVRMPARRRGEILRWVRARGGVIVEDDHHGGLSAEPPLFATAACNTAASPDRMVYAGSLGPLLTPTLQIGYLVLSDRLRQDWAQLLVDAVAPPPWMDQQSARYLLAEGQLARQVRQLRLAYRRKREIVLAELAPAPGCELAGVELVGAADGTHACLLLPPGVGAAPLAAELARLGLSAPTLASFASRGDGWNGRDGLVIGYGHLPDGTLRRALNVVVHRIGKHLATLDRAQRAG